MDLVREKSNLHVLKIAVENRKIYTNILKDKMPLSPGLV